MDRSHDLWHVNGDVAGSIEALTLAVAGDPRCCAPYREFSRLFLGPNSPYIQLRSAGRAAARAEVLGLWSGGENPLVGSQCTGPAGYAAAHAPYSPGEASEWGPRSKGAAEGGEAFRRLARAPATASAASPAAAAPAPETPAAGYSRVLFVTAAPDVTPELEALEQSAALAGVDLRVLGLGKR